MQASSDPSTHDELRSIRRALRRIERALDRGLKDGQGPGCCGIGLAQCHALLAIRPEGSALSRLSRELGVEASTLTRTLDGLETAGLVTRHPSLDDRRRSRVELSENGRSKVEQIDTAWNAWLAEALSSIPQEKRDLVSEGISLLAAALAPGAEEEAWPCC